MLLAGQVSAQSTGAPATASAAEKETAVWSAEHRLNPQEEARIPTFTSGVAGGQRASVPPIVTDTLGILAEIAYERAKASAYMALRDQVKQELCDQLKLDAGVSYTLHTASGLEWHLSLPEGRLLERTCQVIDSTDSFVTLSNSADRLARAAGADTAELALNLLAELVRSSPAFYVDMYSGTVDALAERRAELSTLVSNGWATDPVRLEQTVKALKATRSLQHRLNALGYLLLQRARMEPTNASHRLGHDTLNRQILGLEQVLEAEALASSLHEASLSQLDALMDRLSADSAALTGADLQALVARLVTARQLLEASKAKEDLCSLKTATSGPETSLSEAGCLSAIETAERKARAAVDIRDAMAKIAAYLKKVDPDALIRAREAYDAGALESASEAYNAAIQALGGLSRALRGKDSPIPATELTGAEVTVKALDEALRAAVLHLQAQAKLIRSGFDTSDLQKIHRDRLKEAVNLVNSISSRLQSSAPLTAATLDRQARAFLTGIAIKRPIEPDPAPLRAVEAGLGALETILKTYPIEDLPSMAAPADALTAVLSVLVEGIEQGRAPELSDARQAMVNLAGVKWFHWRAAPASPYETRLAGLDVVFSAIATCSKAPEACTPEQVRSLLENPERLISNGHFLLEAPGYDTWLKTRLALLIQDSLQITGNKGSPTAQTRAAFSLSLEVLKLVVDGHPLLGEGGEAALIRKLIEAASTLVLAIVDQDTATVVASGLQIVHEVVLNILEEEKSTIDVRVQQSGKLARARLNGMEARWKRCAERPTPEKVTACRERIESRIDRILLNDGTPDTKRFEDGLQAATQAIERVLPVVQVLVANAHSLEDAQENPENAEALRKARKESLEALVEASTQRTNRSGDTLISLGSYVGFNYSPWSWKRTGGGLEPEDPQLPLSAGASRLTLPMGLSFQWLSGSHGRDLKTAKVNERSCYRKYVGTFVQVSLVDLAQLLPEKLEDNTSVHVDWQDFVSPGIQFGALLGRNPHHQFALGIDARYTPYLNSAYQFGVFFTYYVPFLDLN